jgi:hypothetical protein
MEHELLALIKSHTHSMDMIYQIRVGDLLENGEIKGVGQEQVVNIVADSVDYGKVQAFTFESQIYV